MDRQIKLSICAVENKERRKSEPHHWITRKKLLTMSSHTQRKDGSRTEGMDGRPPG